MCRRQCVDVGDRRRQQLQACRRHRQGGDLRRRRRRRQRLGIECEATAQHVKNRDDVVFDVTLAKHAVQDAQRGQRCTHPFDKCFDPEPQREVIAGGVDDQATQCHPHLTQLLLHAQAAVFVVDDEVFEHIATREQCVVGADVVEQDRKHIGSLAELIKNEHLQIKAGSDARNRCRAVQRTQANRIIRTNHQQHIDVAAWCQSTTHGAAKDDRRDEVIAENFDGRLRKRFESDTTGGGQQRQHGMDVGNHDDLHRTWAAVVARVPTAPVRSPP